MGHEKNVIYLKLVNNPFKNNYYSQGKLKMNNAQVLANILFSHLGLLLLVVGYAVGGAKVFMSLEKEREDLAVSFCQYIYIVVDIV